MRMYAITSVILRWQMQTICLRAFILSIEFIKFNFAIEMTQGE
jgi:hypothetical protein